MDQPENPNALEEQIISEFDLTPLEAWHVAHIATFLVQKDYDQAANYAFKSGYDSKHKVWLAAQRYDQLLEEKANQVLKDIKTEVTDALKELFQELRKRPTDSDPTVQ